MWLTLWRKNGFVNIYPLLLIWSKIFFKQIQIFVQDFFLFKHGKKIHTFWVFQCSFLRLSLLCLKRTVFYEFLQKCFKTTERHSLAICGSLCGEKQFLLIFIRFDWFDPKHLLKQIQIFLMDLPLFKHGKKKKLSEYFSARFWDSHFMSRNKSSLWISTKMLKNNRKA